MSENTDDRDRGILTPTDRAFLRGEKEYANPETASHRRRDIRRRVRNSIADFTLLATELDVDDREKIFDELDENPYHQGLIDTFAFLCMGLNDDMIPASDDFRIPEFESILRQGLRRALVLMGYYPHDIDPDLGIQAHDESTIQHLKKSLQQEDALHPTPEMVRLLVEAREVDWDNLLEFLQEEVDPPEDPGRFEQVDPNE